MQTNLFQFIIILLKCYLMVDILINCAQIFLENTNKYVLHNNYEKKF